MYMKIIRSKITGYCHGVENTIRKASKVLKLAKGFRGGESRIYRTANQAVMRSMQNAYIGRKRRKRDFYTPGGEMGKRPDYATVVYGNLIRRTYKKTPINQ